MKSKAKKALETTIHVWYKNDWDTSTYQEILDWAIDLVENHFHLSGWFKKETFIEDIKSKEFGSRKDYIEYQKAHDAEILPYGKKSMNIQDMITSCVSNGFHNYIK